MDDAASAGGAGATVVVRLTPQQFAQLLAALDRLLLTMPPSAARDGARQLRQALWRQAETSDA